MDLLAELGALALASRFKRLVDRLVQDGIRVYRDAGVAFEPRWFPVYYYLSHVGPSGVTDIARGLGVSHPAVNQVAREMARAGLVATYKDVSDKRRRVLALTRAGKQMLPTLEGVWRDVRAALQEIVNAGGDDFLDRVAAIERALDSEGFHARFLARHDPSRLEAVAIADLSPADVPAFAALNEAWIVEHFEMEDADRRMLEDPIGYVVEPGGVVLVAKDRNSDAVLGTCALVNHGDGVVELAKMTVSRIARGLGIGKLIGRAALERARREGYRRIFLETNSSLAPALQLYRELGFVERPSPFVSDYARADIYMERAVEGAGRR